jgi:hypothetical protein
MGLGCLLEVSGSDGFAECIVDKDFYPEFV